MAADLANLQMDQTFKSKFSSCKHSSDYSPVLHSVRGDQNRVHKNYREQTRISNGSQNYRETVSAANVAQNCRGIGQSSIAPQNSTHKKSQLKNSPARTSQQFGGEPTESSNQKAMEDTCIDPSSAVSDNTALPVSKKSSAQIIRDKKKQTMITLQWLEENYCICEGVCLPRNVLYAHYLDFCQKQNLEPACAATFGKTIRQKFPHLTTRRLGTRGHSKYHYYGIGIRETSQYYNAVYSSTGLTRFSGSQLHSEGGFTRKYSIGSKVGTLLPEFPSAAYLILPEHIPVEKVETFLMMYRTHCQCVLDTTINGSFKEIETFLLHFWQGLPQHMTSLLQHDVIENVICLCDTILAKTVVDVLIPASMQEMPETLLCDIRNLANHWPRWVTSSLESLPIRLQQKKTQVARRFSQYLKRQVSFLHLAQTARPVLYDVKIVNQMIDDIDALDMSVVTSDFMSSSLMSLESDTSKDTEFVADVMAEFKDTLRKQATIESFIEWIDSLVESKVMKLASQSGGNVQSTAKEFLLKWSFLGSRVSHCLTLNNAPSFGSVHLLRLLLDEYTFLALESHMYEQSDQHLQELVRDQTQTDETGNFPKYSNIPGSSFLAIQRQAASNSNSCLKQEETPRATSTHEVFSQNYAPMYCTGMERNTAPSTNHLSHLSHLTQRINPDPAILTPPNSPITSNSVINNFSETDAGKRHRMQHFDYTASFKQLHSRDSQAYNNQPSVYPSFAHIPREYDLENMYNIYHTAYGNYMNGCALQGFNNAPFVGVMPNFAGPFEESCYPRKTQANARNNYHNGWSTQPFDWYKKHGGFDGYCHFPYNPTSSKQAMTCNLTQNHQGSFSSGSCHDSIGGSCHSFHNNPQMLHETMFYDSVNNLSSMSSSGYS